MRLEITLPDGETVTVDSSELALRNTADNSAIALFVARPGKDPLILGVYAGAHLATGITATPWAPDLLCSPDLLCWPSPAEGSNANSPER